MVDTGKRENYTKKNEKEIELNKESERHYF